MDPGSLALVALIGVAAFAAMTFRKMFAKGGVDAEHEVWTRAAVALGGIVKTTPGSVVAQATRRIRIPVDGVIVTIESIAVSGGEGLAVSVGRLPGLSDVRIQTVSRNVTGSPTAIVRALFDAELRGRTSDLGVDLRVEERRLQFAKIGRVDIEMLLSFGRLAQRFAERWIELAHAPSVLANGLRLETAEAIVPLGREGETRLIARGVRRGREIELGVRIERKRIVSVLGAKDMVVRVEREGLAPDPIAMLEELDALIDREGGAYR